MTGSSYQTGKNPAFQFVSDPMGGYDTAWQQYTWFYHGDGYDAAQALYNDQNMQLIGWMLYGQESLSSSKPLAGFADLEGWKFRSPPGLETEIFQGLGAWAVVDDVFPTGAGSTPPPPDIPPPPTDNPPPSGGGGGGDDGGGGGYYDPNNPYVQPDQYAQ